LFVLSVTAKILAPLAPFSADDIYLRLTDGQAKDSVHLETWPEAISTDEKLIDLMKEVRKVVTLGLEMRMSAGVKVRQPLQSIAIADKKLLGQNELLELVKDELNVKEVIFDQASGEPVWLETKITPALREEGMARDFIRLIQEKRKQENLVPSDQAGLKIFVRPRSQEVFKKFIDEIKLVAGLSGVEFLSTEPGTDPDGSVQEEPVWLDLVR
jgi:isoleucyl-tRNA synthetase